MSKIGQVNMDLQEQANELGFSTIQEAIDNGYEAVYYDAGDARLIPKADAELQKAHEEWLIRKETIINKLEMLRDDTPYQAYKDTLREAINFIKEGEM